MPLPNVNFLQLKRYKLFYSRRILAQIRNRNCFAQLGYSLTPEKISIPLYDSFPFFFPLQTARMKQLERSLPEHTHST